MKTPGAVSKHDSAVNVSTRSEVFWAMLLLFIGVALRLIVNSLFPTQPVSDFRSLVAFAVAFHDSFPAKGQVFWDLFNPGMPFLLSAVLRVFPYSPDVVARWTTAVLTGLIALIPFVLWRNVFSLGIRTFAGILLAIWPGQVLFSGVVAQDNWVLIPSIALSSLAVRALSAKEGHPLWAGVLYVLSTWIRQEMMIALLPVALVAAGLGCKPKSLRRNLFLWGTVVISLFFVIILQRGIATDRYALSTEHGGLALLGAYVPHASLNRWVNPTPYIAGFDPDLAGDRKRLQKESYRLALEEFLKRPQFHLVRTFSAVAGTLRSSDADLMYWSFTADGALPDAYKKRAETFVARLSPFINWWTMGVHSVFLVFFFHGILRRNWSIIIISAVIMLKVFIHAVVVSQARFFLIVVALEFFVVALGIEDIVKRRFSFKSLSQAAALSIVLMGAIVISYSPAAAYVRSHDELQVIYRFSISTPGGGSLACVVDKGSVSLVKRDAAQFELLHRDPSCGETASAECRLTGSGEPTRILLGIKDPYEPGNFPSRILQRVTMDGNTLFNHDIADEPGSSWFSVPLGYAGRGTDKIVLIEIVAVKPDPGCAWGTASRTMFRLSDADSRQ